MCPSENSPQATAPLRLLRQHRADRAERVLQLKRREQQALSLSIEQTRAAVELTRQHESRQQAALAGRYQGQLLSPRMLSGWHASQHQLAAQTAQQSSALQGLLEQQRQVVLDVESARQYAVECLRNVEKLEQLSALLAEEAGWPNHQE